MSAVKETIVVDVPIEQVFDYVAEFAHTPQWDPGVTRSKKLTPGHLKVGDQYSVEVSFAGVPVQMHYTVDRVERPHRVVLIGRSSQSEAVDDIRFEALDEHQTQITWSLKLRMLGLARLSAPMAQPFLNKLAKQAMAGLTDAFESGLYQQPLDDTQTGRLTSLWQGAATMMDGFIAPSFARPGYEARLKTWDDPAIDIDLSAQCIAVTGANSGIGFATTQGLIARGAHVIMICRDASRAERAKQALLKDAPDAQISIELADLGDLEQVSQLAMRLQSYGPLDALVHNAGMLLGQPAISPQGHELTFSVHVLGPYLLTQRLHDLMVIVPGTRVVFVSSGGMYTQKLKVSKLPTGPKRFDGTVIYAQAKRAQVFLARQFARMLDGVAVSAMHPGWVDTPGVRSALPGFFKVTKSWLRTPEQGADTIIWLVASPDAASPEGLFFFDRQTRTTHLPMMQTNSSEEEIEQLWAMCQRLTKPYTEPESV